MVEIVVLRDGVIAANVILGAPLVFNVAHLVCAVGLKVFPARREGANGVPVAYVPMACVPLLHDTASIARGALSSFSWCWPSVSGYINLIKNFNLQQIAISIYLTV